MRSARLPSLLVAAALGAGPSSAGAQVVVPADDEAAEEAAKPTPLEPKRDELLVDGTAGRPPDRHWLRMLTEVTVMFGAMETQYWLNKKENAFDFEYNADLRNLDERFVSLEAWSLDDNYYEVNAWRHVGQGAANYLFARSNGFSSLESYAVALAQSAAWEFFGEYKEEVSVNDLVMTPRSGSVIGEASWQLGVFFLRSDGAPYQVVGNLLGGYKGFLDRLDGKPALRARRTGPLGMAADVEHRFEVRLGGVRQDAGGRTRGLVRASVSTELILIPQFDRPGRTSQLYAAPAWSEISVTTARSDEWMVDLDVFVRTGITTWYRKDITGRRGYNLMYGLSSAYQYNMHGTPDRVARSKRDQVTIGHIGGGTVDLTVRRDALSVRAAADVYGDFAILRNYAIDAYRAANPGAMVRSTILRDNYHHALGLTARARVVASLDGLRLGAAYQHDVFRSIQGLDRHQDEITDDYPLTDQRGEGRAWLSYELSLREGLNLGLEVAYEVRHRAGQVKTISQSDTEHRQAASLQLVF